MADVDIDKLLEKQEKQEKDRKNKDLLKKGLIFGGIGAAAAAIIIVIAVILLGESSAAYFPLENTGKYVYNKKNKNPEEWQFQQKTSMVGENECRVLNKIDKGDYFSVQEYYIAGKKGIERLAVSKDYGQKKADLLLLLPARLKTGKQFDAGTIKNTAITGTIAETDVLSTPVGECKSYRVEYRAGSYVNFDVWYGKGVGIVKYTDKVSGDELDLVSRDEK